MPKPVKLAHIVYMTRRYEAMIAWYQDVFEATVVHQDPALAFLTYDDEHHRFAFANLDVLKPEAGGPEAGEIGVNHVAYTYASPGDLLQTYARLKVAGLTPYWPVHHGMTLSLYYKDPDGNRLELQVDACTAEEASAMMSGGAFAANPIGVEFNPEVLLAQYERGADAATLLAQPAGPRSAIPQAHGLS